MKLNKFEVEKLSIEEMIAIKAGSGGSQSGSMSCTSNSGDYDTIDSCGDTD